ncbi:MAG: type II toxin-antitoxin system RelB/DinJ family antitoxin [Ignavibacteria bacterium]|nr:type II toxin-antitoxin system RelB/DinJ family antitoxin [Ignavibacteria bacterium]MCU7501723.1 type II toxin-antitoxin system RelB/DinJ family antitoxin [Ignavibacteria bacterium]MCU7516870.1 type II toxin-antitoxin system RelB/DinJ family antitoxin [Ignavibacteria bacterium]
MAKTATIRARIEPELKSEVENIFKKLGVSTTEVISMLYSQVKLTKGLPFEVKLQTKTATAASAQKKKGKRGGR